MSRLAAGITAAVAALFMTACAQPGSGRSGVDTAVAAAGGVSEIYVVPAADPRKDGAVYRRAASVASGQAVADRMVATGTDVRYVPACAPRGAARDHIRWYSSATSTLSLARPGLTAGAIDGLPVATPPLASLDLVGVGYAQVGDNVTVIRNGKISATYPLPVLHPDGSAGMPPKGYKGLFSGVSVGDVTALVPTPTGDVLAFTSNGRAAAVTDVTTGVSAPLAGFSMLGSAALDSAGRVTVLGWRGLDLSWTIRAVTLDSATLSVLSISDTGLAATDRLRDQIIPGFGHGAIVTVAHGDETAGIHLEIWTLDGVTLARGPTLPPNSGLEIAPAGPTVAFVYGGLAHNTVSQLDLTTGILTPDIAALRTPPGSYVVAMISN